MEAGAACAQPATESAKGADSPIEEKTSKDYYFDSYSHYTIHEDMLKDRVRTETYMNAIMQNKHLFKDKIVLDVGCGTGILCMFAAKAGAKKVIGIECADIYYSAQKIIEENGFKDKITLLKGRLEDLELPEGIDKVDIIVSEWMGYLLLYESMLDTVLLARDRWLKPGGMLFPDKATIYLTAIEDEEYRREKFEFWDNVYGFKMSCIKEQILTEPLVDFVYENQVIADAKPIFTIDLYTVTKDELVFSVPFKLTFSQQNICHAFLAYFDVEFTKSHRWCGFSTAPDCTRTHWKQTVFYLQEPLYVKIGTTISGQFSLSRNKNNPRDLDIHITSECDGVKNEQLYRLR